MKPLLFCENLQSLSKRVDVQIGLPDIVLIARVIRQYLEETVVIDYAALDFREVAGERSQISSVLHIVKVDIVGAVFVAARQASEHYACMTSAVLRVHVPAVADHSAFMLDAVAVADVICHHCGTRAGVQKFRLSVISYARTAV